MTYVDDHGASVYGQRIRNLGESASLLYMLSDLGRLTRLSQTTLNR